MPSKLVKRSSQSLTTSSRSYLFGYTVVHFTDISREISALKVSQMLDRLYQAFDKIANTRHVFKVETIGVTNLDNQHEENHVSSPSIWSTKQARSSTSALVSTRSSGEQRHWFAKPEIWNLWGHGKHSQPHGEQLDCQQDSLLGAFPQDTEGTGIERGGEETRKDQCERQGRDECLLG
jgi:hypothetical protein